MASLKTLTIAGVTYTLKAVYDGDGNEITQVYIKKESGKGLSSNDFTNDLKTKLEGIESGAQKNTVTSVAGKVGAVTVSKSDVGLGNVDNTSDLSKPISTATQTALDKKADATALTEEISRAKTKETEIEGKMYESVTVDSSISNMGQLRTYINNINSQGKHVFFDLHNYVSNAYVCTISMFSQSNVNYALVYDLINKTTYLDYSGYSDSTTVANYLSNNNNDLVSVVKLSDASITLAEVKTILDEVNGLGHHVLFDTYSLGQAGFYLTTISFTDSDSKLTIFDLVGAKLNTVAYKSDMTLVEVMQGASKVITEENARTLTDLISSVSYRVAKLEGKTESVEWADVQAKVIQGFGNDYFPTYDKDKGEAGTQIIVDLDFTKDGGSTYATPFNVVLHSEKASTSPIAILDDTWSIDSYHTTNVTDESKFDTDMGTENTHANHLMYLESEYTLPFTTQFDAPEALLVVAEGKTLPAGTYYIKWFSSEDNLTDGVYSRNRYLQFTLTSDVESGHQLRFINANSWHASMTNGQIAEYESGKSTSVIQTTGKLVESVDAPSGTYLGYVGGTNYGTDGVMNDYLAYDLNDGIKHYLNSGDRIKLGYNRWSQSGLRQYLNAEGTDWWKPMNTFDVAPYYQGKYGFLSDISDELKKVIVPVRRWQKRTSWCEGGTYEYTYDKVFLHVPYERYCNTENNGSKEGSTQRWANYKSLLDTWNDKSGTSLTQFNLWATYDVLKKYSMANITSSQHYWSSSARRSYGFLVWFVNSVGLVNTEGTYYGAIACCPAFVVSK